MNQDQKQNEKPLHPVQAHQRQQLAKDRIKAEIEALCAEHDQLPASDPRRAQLVSRIAGLNVEYQAED